MDGYKHYIRIDQAGIIVHGFSSAFEQPQDGDILILEDGPRHFHLAWSEPLVNDRGQYRFKWQDGQIVERSQAELDAEWASHPPQPETPEQKIARLEAELAVSREENLTAYTAIAELYEMFLAARTPEGGGTT